MSARSYWDASTRRGHGMQNDATVVHDYAILMMMMKCDKPWSNLPVPLTRRAVQYLVVFFHKSASSDGVPAELWCDALRYHAYTLTGRVCTVCIRAIIRELPPTPSKFHYIFNLRDLSRIYNGLTMTTPDRFDRVHQFLRVWRHECIRVFFDRLINDADRSVIHVRVTGSVSNT